jgi:hypothetical protein
MIVVTLTKVAILAPPGFAQGLRRIKQPSSAVERLRHSTRVPGYFQPHADIGEGATYQSTFLDVAAWEKGA